MKKFAEKLDIMPYPGLLGKRIYENISKEAWKKWQDKQTILINEKKLNMAYSSHRSIIEQEMEKFFFKS